MLGVKQNKLVSARALKTHTIVTLNKPTAVHVLPTEKAQEQSASLRGHCAMRFFCPRETHACTFRGQDQSGL